MEEPREEVADLLEDKPNVEPVLREILEVEGEEPWEFNDISAGSGLFGEIVSRGLVESVDDGYRVVDPEAMRDVLEIDGSTADRSDSSGTVGADRRSLASVVRLPSVPRRVVITVGGLLVLLVLMRVVFVFPQIYRDGNVVLAGNDPYGYRYWIETLLETDVTLLDPGRLPDVLGPRLAQDYLYVLSVWALSLLLGGTPQAVGHVLAWFPVGAALLTGLIVYAIAVRISRDRRIGLAALGLFALTPVHAYRSMLGFGDHHAFDYFWLAVTLLCLVYVAGNRWQSRTFATPVRVPRPGSRAAWLPVVGLGVAVAGQTLAWRGGLLLLTPVAFYAIYRAVSNPRADESPLSGNAPLIAGLGIAAGLTLLPHLLWGWVSVVRAVAPLLLLLLTVLVTLLSGVGPRYGVAAKTVTGVAVTVSAVAGLALTFLPPFSGFLSEGVQYLYRTGSSNIAETVSVFSLSGGGVVGPLVYFSLIFFLAVPYVVITLWQSYASHDPVQFTIGSYGVFFTLLSVVQVRFAGHLSVPMAVLAGVSFVRLLVWIDIVEWSTPFDNRDRQADISGRIWSFGWPSSRGVAHIMVAFLLVTSLSFVQIPVKQSQLTIDTETYETARWIESYSETHRIPNDERYVLSPWGRNRVYNYIVNGNSRSYAYAQNNYTLFLGGTNPNRWYEALVSEQVRFIVTLPTDAENQRTMVRRLHDHLSEETNRSTSLSHYRTVYADADLSPVVTMVVPGTTVVGAGDPGSVISVSKPVTVGNRSFTYTQEATVNPYGVYAVTVPYSGEYQIDGRTVEVSEPGILAGRRLHTHDREGVAHWPFDTNQSRIAYDRVGGYRGKIVGGAKVSGVDGQAVSFNSPNSRITSQGYVTIPENQSFTLSFWIKGDPLGNDRTFPEIIQVGSDRSTEGFGVWARDETDDLGVRFNGENGTSGLNFGIDDTEFDGWTHVAAVLDRGERTVSLYRNGSLVSVRDVPHLGEISGRNITIGDQLGGRSGTVVIDNIRLYKRALTPGPAGFANGNSSID